ncbi:MAG TPA: hypothetical protein VL125_03240 [Pelobium sp.]|nr:hypothetical protein [Pelobium sp.]
MVEVYSTNVQNQEQAEFLLYQLGKVFPAYAINFDLEDCDKILRVESVSEAIEVFKLISLVKDFGFIAEVLPDTPKYSKEQIAGPQFENLLS